MIEILNAHAAPKPPGGPSKRPGPPSIYPVRDLKPGQSLFAPRPISVGYWRTATGFKLTMRRVTEDGVAGVRVWRMA